MNYYKNMIKNKCYNVLIGEIFLVLLGLFTCYISMESIFTKGISDTGISQVTVTNAGPVGFLAETNIGLFILGFFLFYYGLTVPITAEECQNPEEFEVKFSGDNVYVKFRKYEFFMEKSRFNETHLAFSRDKNGKFVTLTRAYQITNFVTYNYKDNFKVPRKSAKNKKNN